MTAPPPVQVDRLSMCSLLLECRFGDEPLSTATGFVVERESRRFLISNWHVLTGRDPDTGKPLSSSAAVPDRIAVGLHRRVYLGDKPLMTWGQFIQPLFHEDGEPAWVEHPLGRAVDVAALELTSVPGDALFHPLDLSLANADIFVGVGMPVSIIGFPLGLAGGGLFPIWKTGHVASEPEVAVDDKPMFLVDATTRSGMSGAPVIHRFHGHGYSTRNRVPVIAPGTFSVASTEITRFLGVYAGRIHEDVEIGRVWRPSTVEEILTRALASQAAV